MRPHSLLPAFFSLATAATPTSTPTPKATTLFQLPNVGTWFENLATTTVNIILTTRIDVPEVWRVSPYSPGSGKRLLSIPGVTSLLGITAVPGCNDFVVVGGNVTGSVADAAGSFGAYLVTVSDTQAQSARLVKFITGPVAASQLWNGNVLFNKRIVLVADSLAGAVFAVDLVKGTSYIALQDPTMSSGVVPTAIGASVIGINGVKIHAGFLYYSNTARKTVYRVRLAKDRPAMVGPVETLVSGVQTDDFWVAEDGTLYLASTANQIVKVDAVTRKKTVLVSVKGPTACRLGTGRERDTLFVSTDGGLTSQVQGTVVEPAKIVAVQV